MDTNTLPDLKQLIGSLIFGASRALSVREIRKCLVEVAATVGKETKEFEGVKDGDIKRAIAELKQGIDKSKSGFSIVEVSGGYKLQSDVSCGKWLKNLLNKGRQDRLSLPGLETLAIIAYRQPSLHR